MLPKILLPEHYVYLPVLNKKVPVRAMTTAEEKLLLLAKDAGAEEDIIRAISNLVESCLVDESVRIDILAVPDIIALFIGIIDLSKGSEINHIYTCTNDIEGVECGEKVVVNVDLKNVQYTKPEAEDTIEIQSGVFVKMRYMNKNDIGKDDIIPLCISSVITNDDVISDFSEEEIKEWYKTLPLHAIQKMKHYVLNMPTPYLEYDIVCPKCKNTTKVKLTTIQDFFTNDIPAQQF